MRPRRWAIACLLLSAGLGAWCPRAALGQVARPEVHFEFENSAFRNQTEPDIMLDGDRLLIAFYGGSGSSNAWTLSSDGGAIWSANSNFPWLPGALVDTNEGFPSLCLVGAGRLLCVQGVASGVTLSVTAGDVAGTLNWSFRSEPTERLSGAQCSRYNNPRLVHDAVDGVTYLTYTRSFDVARDACNSRIELLRSMDEGLTWSPPLVLNDPSRSASQGAQPVVGPDGELYVVWRDYGSGDVRVRRSDDHGLTFGPETVVAPVAENVSPAPSWTGRGRSHPVRLADDAWMSDFPAVAVDTSSGPRRGTLYVAWAEGPQYTLLPSTGTASDIEPNESPETGSPSRLGDDIVGFASSGGGGDCDYFRFEGVAGQVVHLTAQVTAVFPSPSPGAVGGGSYLFYQDPVTGAFFSVASHRFFFNGGYGPGTPILLTLPRTGSYAVCAECGIFYSVGYRIRTREARVDPGSVARDHRDLVMVSSSDRGASWTPKRLMGDAPPGYDECLPALAVDEAGRLHAAWYDRREGGPLRLGTDARWALSLDGGLSWLPSLRLSGASGTWLSYGGTRSNIGDRIALAAGGGRAHVVWVDGRNVDGPFDDYDLYTARVDLGVVGIAVPRFAAEGEAVGVRLRWTLSDASGVTGFRVHRLGEAAAVVSSQAPRGEGEYEALDESLAEGASASYRLEVQRGSRSEWLGPVEASRPAPVRALAWSRVGPSPFSRDVSMTLAMPAEGEVSVRVYDLAGHEVARLHEGRLPAGPHTLVWRGGGANRANVPPGMYLVRARSGREEAVQRVVRIE